VRRPHYQRSSRSAAAGREGYNWKPIPTRSQPFIGVADAASEFSAQLGKFAQPGDAAIDPARNGQSAPVRPNRPLHGCDGGLRRSTNPLAAG
jgi:hypothetical protein